MLNNNIQSELQEAQQKKIDYFCEFINDNNIIQAEHYLNKANWDENLAIQNYFYRYDKNNNNNKIDNIPKEKNLKRHTSVKMNNKINNNIVNTNYVKPYYNMKNKYIEFNVENILNKDIKSIHHYNDKLFLYIKNNLYNVETNFQIFIKKLENNAGIFLIFREESFSKIKFQIEQINELKEKVKNYIIFPVSSNSKEGIEIILGLCCVSYPSYIFCKYKNENTIFITDKMEGAFDKTFLLECISKIISSLSPIFSDKDNNMKLPEKPQVDSKKKENEDIFQKIHNEFKNNKSNIKERHLIDKNRNQKDKRIPVQRKNHNNNLNKNEIQNDEINIYNKENIIENNRKQNKINYENNNIIINNNNINNEIKSEMDINYKKKKNMKNEIDYPNYGDFFLGDSIEIPNLFGVYNNSFIPDYNLEKQDNNIINKENKINKDNDQHIFNNNNNNLNKLEESDMRLRDSIYNLSDGQVLAKREEEIKKLEKIQEEKEKREKEEKRRQEEEEKKIKNYEKESEYAKMILAPEPDDKNPDTCHIRFRLPDGEKVLERKFLKSDKISVLYDYIKSIGREIFMEPDANDFNIICMGFPPKNLENLKNSTLEKEGLYPNSILQIQEK